MPEAAAEFAELELIEKLIAGLEGMIAEADETPLAIETGGRPRRASYRVLGNAAVASDRKIQAAEAIYMDDKRLVLRCNKTDVVRLTELEITVQAEKSGRGETLAVVNGKVLGLKRVSGGYDIGVEIGDVRKSRITPGQKLRECLDKGDATGWNRWCQDIRDSLDLTGMDLQKADLSGYDLCCADLSGADLGGANLSGAVLAGADLARSNLEQATVAGTDFFRARMNRSQTQLLSLSGMPEVESVVFED